MTRGGVSDLTDAVPGSGSQYSLGAGRADTPVLRSEVKTGVRTSGRPENTGSQEPSQVGDKEMMMKPLVSSSKSCLPSTDKLRTADPW